MFKRIAAVMALMALSAVASAQSYPTRPIRIVVGYPAGGSPDVYSRIFGQKIGQILGQPVVIENKPGAAGVIATSYVKETAPDGYTLLLGELGQLQIAPLLSIKVPYNYTDFMPIAGITAEPLVLVTSAESPIRDFVDFLKRAKERPDEYSYGSAGVGSIHHVVFETLKADTGIKVLHVPYRGSAASVPAAVAGQVSVALVSFTTSGSLIAAGKLRPLAVTSLHRVKRYPNIPAISETVKGFDFASEMGILAPAGTPQPIVETLGKAFKEAAKSQDVTSKFSNTETMIEYRNPQEYAKFLADSYKKIERAVTVAQIPKH